MAHPQAAVTVRRSGRPTGPTTECRRGPVAVQGQLWSAEAARGHPLTTVNGPAMPPPLDFTNTRPGLVAGTLVRNRMS